MTIPRPTLLAGAEPVADRLVVLADLDRPSRVDVPYRRLVRAADRVRQAAVNGDQVRAVGPLHSPNRSDGPLRSDILRDGGPVGGSCGDRSLRHEMTIQRHAVPRKRLSETFSPDMRNGPRPVRVESRSS